MISVGEVLQRTERFFREHEISSPRLDAQLLLAKVLQLDKLQLYLILDRPLTEDELAALRPLVRRRCQREPMMWILETGGFHAIDLHITPGVLCPRPDTETLVEAALEWIALDDEPVFVADVGCGSGAIGLAVAVARPNVRLYATDLSEIATALTKKNVHALKLDQRVAVLCGDLLSPIPTKRPVDWVLSNPPYIPSATINTLQPEVSRHEPRLALDGGADGLDIYRRLIPIAANRAREGLLLEVGVHQAHLVLKLCQDAGFKRCQTWDDYGGITRVVGARHHDAPPAEPPPTEATE